MRRLCRLLAFLVTAALCPAQGIITTIAGTGVGTTSGGDGGSALNARLSAAAVTVDTAGNIYLVDQNARIRKVTASTGIITSMAGTGNSGYSGDGGLALSAELWPGDGIAVDQAGNVYFSDPTTSRIRKITVADGRISTVAGNGNLGFSGDGGQATQAMIDTPKGLAIDQNGNLYIADQFNNRIRKVSAAGIITTIVGLPNNNTFSGDGGLAVNASLNTPMGVAVDSAGNVYISDTGNVRVRKIDTAGIITTIAGNGTRGFSGDGGQALNAAMDHPNGTAVDERGNVYFKGSDARVRKVDAAGIISTAAGTGSIVFSGDGGNSVNAGLGHGPDGIATDSSGNLYIAAAARIRKVTPGASLISNPGSLSFSYTIGGANPAGQILNIGSGAPLNYAVAVTTTPPANWLSATPGSGSTPGQVTVSVNPAGLTVGTYRGNVALTPSTAGSVLNIAVTLTVISTASPAPVINPGGVVNATGYQNKLAPGALFTIFGRLMGPDNIVTAAAPNYPTSLGGASITFTPVGGGAAITARVVYTLAGQVAGLLPSSITPGTYAVRVTYNGQASAPENVVVVARSFGIATANSAGTGPAQATIGNVDGGLSLVRLTTGSLALGGFTWTLTPSHPGDTLVFWGTGGGADPANDTGGTSGDQTAAGNFVVIVNGQEIVPLYAGASFGYPGLWQINFRLPADIGLDCFAQVRVRTSGELSNLVTIAIAAAGQTACSDPSLSPAVLSKIDANGELRIGVVAIFRSVNPVAGTSEFGSGSFSLFKAAKYALNFSGPKVDRCLMYDRTYPVGGVDPSAGDALLEAGEQLHLVGPPFQFNPGLPMGKLSGPIGPAYISSPAAGTWVGGATYTVNGTGGAQIGAFSASTVFPSSFVVTNFSSITAVNRNQPLAVNWTSSGVDQVIILVSTVVITAPNQRITSLTCTAPAAPGTYAIPAAALALLQASATGVISVNGGSTPGTFTANVAGGGQTDLGVFGASLGVSKSVPIQ
ncbi:MAG: hypothetical protein AAB225_26995 [Acidobacteriota bacterium]